MKYEERIKEAKKTIEDRVNATTKGCSRASLMAQLKHAKKLVRVIDKLKYEAGAMIFTGRSGKVDDSELIAEVAINSVAGCVIVPELLLELADYRVTCHQLKLDESS